MISSSEAHDTGSGPVSDVFARLHEIERDSGVLDASLFLTQPWFDAPEVGWTSVVVTDDDPALAQWYADELAEMVWNRRRSTFVTKTPIPAALSEVVSSPRSARPFVLADCADSPSAGSSGDGVSLLAALLAEPVDDVVLLTVTDPGAVEACFTAGVDGEVQTTVGGSCATEWFAAVPVHGRVETLADGRFTGRYSPGPAYVGRVAVLAVGSMKLVITEYPASMLDYQLYLRVGLQPSEAKIVQVKSAGGYRAYYGPLAHRMIDLETSGPSGSDLASMPFVRVSRPLWPFDTTIETPW
jgi:microcystin degradation protein MlrC